jgi:translation initiation factor IF-3
MNEAIIASQLMVIDSDGEQLGLLDKSEALRLAQEQSLDLIEVSPNSKPPVAKILSWSKFKYQQDKKRKENKGKSIEMKEMWFKAFIGEGDFNHKIERIKEFLNKKHSVKIIIRGKGRVQSAQLWKLLEKIKLALIDSIQESLEEAKQEGRNINWIVRPVKINKINTNENENKNT